eukprot:12469623-Prorocentrum_lima.AAC.1
MLPGGLLRKGEASGELLKLEPTSATVMLALNAIAALLPSAQTLDEGCTTRPAAARRTAGT